jgi:hypothetical protein
MTEFLELVSEAVGCSAGDVRPEFLQVAVDCFDMSQGYEELEQLVRDCHGILVRFAK